MDHLACFMGGMLALDGLPGHLDIAKEMAYTCWQLYDRNPSKLAPEIATFNDRMLPSSSTSCLALPPRPLYISFFLS
jgi:hypothetical protein